MSRILLRDLRVASKIPYMQDFIIKFSRLNVEVIQNRKNVGKSYKAKANAENTLRLNLATVRITAVQMLSCRYKQYKLARFSIICFKMPALRNNLYILYAHFVKKLTNRNLKVP